MGHLRPAAIVLLAQIHIICIGGSGPGRRIGTSTTDPVPSRAQSTHSPLLPSLALFQLYQTYMLCYVSFGAIASASSFLLGKNIFSKYLIVLLKECFYEGTSRTHAPWCTTCIGLGLNLWNLLY